MPPSRSSTATAVAPESHRRTLSSTLIDESVAAAAEVVQKYNVVSTTSSGSLFLRSGSGDDHNLFLRATADLHRAMLFFASHEDATTTNNNNGGLVQAQELLQTAMSRLCLELRLLLGHVDDNHNDDDDHVQVMISSIIRTMMAAGYGKECLSTFKSTRRSALAAKLSIHSDYLKNMNKLGWDQVDATIIQPWLCVATTAFTSLFPKEKQLCDSVFADSGVGEAVFAAIVNDHATGLLAVAEAAIARARRAPERLFRVLDIHDTLATVEEEITSVFSTTINTGVPLVPPADNEVVATRAGLVIGKAAEAAGATLVSFETAILHKEASSNKGGTAPGGGVHPLTRYVMNYLVFLADYQQQQLVVGIRAWICRLVSSLLSKLECKAGSYKEAALSYLFLANNTHYVAKKVRGSSKLHMILGDDWAETQSAKARGHVQVYTRAVWGKVISSTMMTMVESKAAAAAGAGVVVQTGGLVMEAVQVQDQWMAADEEMAKALRAAATAAVLPKYRLFYRRHGVALSLTPGDVTAMIAALFTSVLVTPVSQPQEPNAVVPQ
ncbi:hypothetical protein QOZ80_9BG0695260 [Eleusine coracana subsp. coracana]|nr:hypothetical protein QOZ80_9BG0695260 [Eleusine coracana subsp. coracana]